MSEQEQLPILSQPDPSERQRIGVEMVYGVGRYSFRIRNTKGEVIEGMDCPMWFSTKAEAKACSEKLMTRVMALLRQRGIRVAKA